MSNPSNKYLYMVLLLLVQFHSYFLPVGASGQMLKVQGTYQELRKPLNSNKIGWILLGTGATLSLTGIMLPEGRYLEEYPDCFLECKTSNEDVKVVLVLVGTAAALASIPFFITSIRDKEKKVRIDPGLQLQQGGLSPRSRMIPVVNLRIAL